MLDWTDSYYVIFINTPGWITLKKHKAESFYDINVWGLRFSQRCLLKFLLFKDVMVCWLVNIDQHFKGFKCLLFVLIDPEYRGIRVLGKHQQLSTHQYGITSQKTWIFMCVCVMCGFGIRGFAISCFTAVPTLLHTWQSPSSGWMWGKEHAVQYIDMPLDVSGQYRIW